VTVTRELVARITAYTAFVMDDDDDPMGLFAREFIYHYMCCVISRGREANSQCKGTETADCKTGGWRIIQLIAKQTSDDNQA